MEQRVTLPDTERLRGALYQKMHALFMDPVRLFDMELLLARAGAIETEIDRIAADTQDLHDTGNAFGLMLNHDFVPLDWSDPTITADDEKRIQKMISDLEKDTEVHPD